MSFTYDVTNDNGRVRLLIADTQEATPLFSDEEIGCFLEFEGDGEGVNNPRRAAALALETIAVDSVRTLKVVQMLDLKTDGAAVARALRQQAQEWRTQADASGGIEIIQMLEGPEAQFDYLMKRWIAES